MSAAEHPPFDPRSAPDDATDHGRGDLDGLERAFTAQYPRLRRTVQLHLDSRLVGRVDPDDVLQESYLEVRKRLDHTRATDGDLFVWLRMIVKQTTIDFARRHLGAQKRAVGRELAIDALPGSTDTAAALQHGFLSRITSPTQAASRAELGERLAAAIAEMSELDREILLLRHFEELSNNETAAVLGIHKAAATNRYLRALRRLREVLPPQLGGHA